jgi:hypothetical protein
MLEEDGGFEERLELELDDKLDVFGDGVLVFDDEGGELLLLLSLESFNEFFVDISMFVFELVCCCCCWCC